MAIARRELGSPTAPALVLIHGLAASGRGMDKVAPLVGPLAWRTASEARVRAGMRSAFAPGHEIPDLFVEDFHRTSREAFTTAGDQIDAYLRKKPLALRIGALTQQALVVFGERDGRVDPAS